MRNNKLSEENFFGRAVKTTNQIPYEKGLFDNYIEAYELLIDCLLIRVNERRRPDLEELNDDKVIERHFSTIWFTK